MKTLRRLACEFDLDQSVHKSSQASQVHASPGQTESQVDPSFQLASTCDSVWPRLYTRFETGAQEHLEMAYLAGQAVRGVVLGPGQCNCLVSLGSIRFSHRASLYLDV